MKIYLNVYIMIVICMKRIWALKKMCKISQILPYAVTMEYPLDELMALKYLTLHFKQQQTDNFMTMYFMNATKMLQWENNSYWENIKNALRKKFQSYHIT